MKISKDIRLAIIKLIEEEITVVSWGISEIKVTYESLSFNVNGLRYKGRIKITAIGDIFRLQFNNHIIENCKAENLVNTLDSKIEYTLNYAENLRCWLNESNDENIFSDLP